MQRSVAVIALSLAEASTSIPSIATPIPARLRALKDEIFDAPYGGVCFRYADARSAIPALFATGGAEWG